MHFVTNVEANAGSVRTSVLVREALAVELLPCRSDVMIEVAITFACDRRSMFLPNASE